VSRGDDSMGGHAPSSEGGEQPQPLTDDDIPF
jgi:hypothetical protein